MGDPKTPDLTNDTPVNMDRLLYASSTQSGPSSAFAALSTRKIDAGVTNVINARFNRHKPSGPT